MEQIQWAAFGAATGSLIAGLHRHISILADSLGSSVGAYLCDPAFCLSSKAKTSGCPTHSFQKKTKEVKAMSQVFHVGRVSYIQTALWGYTEVCSGRHRHGGNEHVLSGIGAWTLHLHPWGQRPEKDPEARRRDMQL